MNNLKNDLHELKKPSLSFELLLDELQVGEPQLDTYFGGKPYITDLGELQTCPGCKTNMDFVFQVKIPDNKLNINTLYSLYFCFDCAGAGSEGMFAMNIYKNPHIDNMLKDFSYINSVPRSYVLYNPIYELPEWDYLEEVYPTIADKFEAAYGDKAIEAYFQIQDRVREHYNETGFKFMGYPETIGVEDIPVCPISGKRMEPFLQMESVPQLGLDWIGKDSYLILFKSPDYDEFSLRCLDNDYDGDMFAEEEFFKEDSDDELL